MLNKEDYAKQITGTYDLNRNIWINKNMFKTWKVGDIYNNYDCAESWSGSDVEEDFRSEKDIINNDVKVVLMASNIPAHKVDYNNVDEVKVLSAFAEEDEYLVNPDTKLRIVDISTDEDYKEMKFYIVEVELA